MDIIVIDSVAALTPKSELEGEIGDTHVALQADDVPGPQETYRTDKPDRDHHDLHQPGA